MASDFRISGLRKMLETLSHSRGSNLKNQMKNQAEILVSETSQKGAGAGME
jgi:hypothetical protein